MAASGDDQRDGGHGSGRAREVRAYRTPRYPVFLITGAVVGLVVGVVVATITSTPTATGGGGVLGYFAAMGAFLGALVAGTLAMIVEWLLNRGRRVDPGRPRRRP